MMKRANKRTGLTMRVVVQAVFIGSILLLIPAVANADKDPFQPLVGQGSGGSLPASSSGTTTSGQSGASVTSPAPATTGASLPRTGIEAGTLLGVALMLIIAGSAMLAADRYVSG